MYRNFNKIVDFLMIMYGTRKLIQYFYFFALNFIDFQPIFSNFSHLFKPNMIRVKLNLCSIQQSNLKLSKMLIKKKPGVSQSKHHHSSSKLASDGKNSVRKSYQKHSRKGTKDYEPIDLGSLINARIYASARELINRNHIQNINSIVFGYNSIYSLQLKQALAVSNTSESLNSYYILSKHKHQYLNGKPTIQSALVQAIHCKSQPNMHFQTNIYPIMSLHMAKRRQYLKKIAIFQNQSSVHREQTPWTKQLPTLVSDRDKEDSDIYDKKRCSNFYDQNGINTSESFQLKKLTQCIKEMFNKQIFDNPKQKIMVWTGGQNSWLQGRSIEKKIQCDYSSIQSSSKYQLQIDSKVTDKWSSDVEENYGLGSLRRKYQQQQRESKLKQSSEIKGKSSFLGHKRNPTQTLHTKQYLLEQPITPKENYRSVFTSSQNIPLNSPKHHKSKSKRKQFDINQAYLLKFQKKKNHNIMKQNMKKQKSKLKTQISKSKSKQKLKFAMKKK